MSQKKVDAYKQEKANREQIIKKEKRTLMLEKLIALVVCLAAVCWIGFSIYGKVTGSSEGAKTTVELDTSAIDNYVSGLSMDLSDLELEDTAE